MEKRNGQWYVEYFETYCKYPFIIIIIETVHRRNTLCFYNLLGTDMTDYSLGKVIGMLWIDSLVYWVLTWYIEAVFPGEYGISKPW